MCKIAVIGMIKNSADVIESFTRGNGVYADKFVLIDNGSTDRTLEILSCLRNEGFDIDIYGDDDNSYLQSMKMNILIKKVRETYNPDWIIPLDDDEILASNTVNGVRNLLDKLDRNKLYFARWKNYIPNEQEDYSEICVLKRQKMCFSFNHKTLSKVILSKEILDTYSDVLIVQGNHDVVNCDAEKIALDQLQIAHFPVRSEAQIMSKALVGWTNVLAMPMQKEGNGGHWKKIYNAVKEGKELTIDMLWEICSLYIEDLEEDGLEIVYEPIVIDEKALEIRYTSSDEINPWINYINNTEQLAQNYKKIREKYGV